MKSLRVFVMPVMALLVMPFAASAAFTSHEKEAVVNYAVIIIGIALLLFFFWALSRDNWKLLRDHGKIPPAHEGENKPKRTTTPFSLSRSQMAWWTFVVLTALLYIWYKEKELADITNQMLVLLGISAGTTVTANYIDNKDITDDNLKVRHQDSASSSNFFLNIISDQSGPSIHRFQNVLFSLAIGCYVLVEVIYNKRIPTLNENLMVLMGISSSTYLAVKNGENKTYQAEIHKEEEN